MKTSGVTAVMVDIGNAKGRQFSSAIQRQASACASITVFDAIKHLATARCPFANLPEKESGRWGQGLTAEKMRECVWLKPQTVAEVAFLEWTGADHLRHTKFIRLRDDKDPRKVARET